MKRINFLCNIILLLFSISVKAQVTTLGNAGANTDYVGWNSAQSFPLIIKHEAAQPMNFFTANIQRMVIRGQRGATQGFVGIGTSFSSPAHLLDVRNGDINVGNGTSGTSTKGYMIDDQFVLRHKGINNDIFVGVGAGASVTTATWNTFVGANSGNSTTTGGENTFIGNTAGFSNTTGKINTYVGTQCGYFTTTGNSNSFLGDEAGKNVTSGSQNVFMGFLTGNVIRSGSNNTYIGQGANAGGGLTGLSNSAAFGANAIVRNNNKMILGNNSINVGIGLSADTYLNGPQNKLEINTSLNGFQPTIAGTVGASGLRFRDLHSTTKTITNPGLGVLSVNTSGDVIYVPAAYGTCVAPTILAASSALGLGGFNFIYSGIGSVGIGTTCTPFNKLEITSENGNPHFGTNNASGLRFTNLTSADQTVANGTFGVDNSKVLTVDENGDVVLTDALAGGSGGTVTADNGLIMSTPTNVELGGLAGSATGAALINDREIPMLNRQLFFTGTGTIGINVPPSNNSNRASLEVNQNTAYTYAIGSLNNPLFQPTPTQGGNIGMRVDMPYTNGAINYGVYSSSTADVVNGISIYGEAIGNSESGNIGVEGYAKAGSNSTSFPYYKHVGVFGRADGYANGGRNYGGYFIANNTAQDNYGIWAEAPTGGNNYAGWFEGSINVNGNIDGLGTLNYVSDARFKNNVQNINDAMDIITQLKPHTYYMDTTNQYKMNFSSKKQYGLIAQEVETILPELVDQATKLPEYDSTGNIITQGVTYKTLNYNAFIAILLQGAKDQQNQIDSMKNVNNSFQTQLDSIYSILSHLPPGLLNGSRTSGNANSGLTIKNVELGGNTVVLEQNVPNPFAEETTINYFIPDDVKFAQVLFYDNLGRIIKTVDIAEKGKGMLNVFASSLGNGIYSYTLVVDGKTVDSKKMLKTK